jgi:hypothetical protein
MHFLILYCPLELLQKFLEPIHKVVEAEGSVVVPCLAPDSALRGSGGYGHSSGTPALRRPSA